MQLPLSARERKGKVNKTQLLEVPVLVSGGRARWKAWAILLPGLAALLVLLSLSPVTQDAEYHRFVDQSVVFGIPHFGDVSTNLAFLLVGFWGLRRRPYELRAYAVFFAGVFLTGLGSAWYHLDPTSERLFWDRLPMTIVFMALVSIVVSERVSRPLGERLLVPLLIAGASSVLYWHAMDDLRFYVLVQFYPMLALPMILLLYRPRYSHSGYFWAMFGWYLLAKGFEFLDGPILELTGFLSGHNLKHAAAAVATYWVLRMLERRRALPEPSREIVVSPAVARQNIV